MRRLPTMMGSAGAAALAALAVTVTVPALGDDGGGNGGKPSDLGEFVSCLRAHGLPDAPSDGAALKPWLGERTQRGDTTAKDALEECSAKTEKAEAVRVEGPEPKALGACLKAKGVNAPSGEDPMALKRWIGEHSDDASVRGAMKACHIESPGKPRKVECGAGRAMPAPGPGAGKTEAGKLEITPAPAGSGT